MKEKALIPDCNNESMGLHNLFEVLPRLFVSIATIWVINVHGNTTQKAISWFIGLVMLIWIFYPLVIFLIKNWQNCKKEVSIPPNPKGYSIRK